VKVITMQQLHRIAGYIEAGEGVAVAFSQDDATKTWLVRVGEDGAYFTGNTLGEAFEAALADANAYHKNTYDMGPAKSIGDCAVAVTSSKYLDMLSDGTHDVVNPYLHAPKNGSGPGETFLFDLSKL